MYITIYSGKADWVLCLLSGHVIQGGDMLYKYLTVLFNGMVIHGYSSSDMIVGTMITILKNKRHNETKSDAFMCICPESALCKLLDIITLTKMLCHMKTSDLEYDFKTMLLVAMATTVVM